MDAVVESISALETSEASQQQKGGDVTIQD